MTGEYRETRTKDSRFLRHKLRTGETELYLMYRCNIRVEADGIAYDELNVVRAILLEPILYVLMGCNMLLAYRERGPSGRSGGLGSVFALVLGHGLGFLFNILRYTVSIIILVIEFILWPLRFLIGVLLAPIGMLLSAGHIYALACSVIHSLLRDAGPVVVREATVPETYVRNKTFNAGRLGQILCYKSRNTIDASYIASSYKIKQRCGVGPECVWIRGTQVFVSDWSAISLTSMFKRKNTNLSWKVLDLSTMTWTVTIFNFEAGRTQTFTEEGRNCRRLQGTNHNQKVGKWASVLISVELGVVSDVSDLELYYNSPLGWNKYHRMCAQGHQIRVIRHDRRALSHLIALMSSLVLYLQFKDKDSIGLEGETGSHPWLGLSLSLYALIIANYTLVTSYAAEILVGKACDIVEAKSDRYGVIVTRAVDRGFIRGFYVPNGDWLQYDNRNTHIPVHEVDSSEVNVTCNSYVYQNNGGPMIRVCPYNNNPSPYDLPWVSSEEAV